ncbi:Gibberellin 2-beta-dioxygenase 1 [Bienertia sinuspersici]
MASSSSAHKPNHLLNLNHLFTTGGPTSAPPPTPSSSQPPSLSSTSSDATTADTLSRLLHRLPPNLSLPTRLSPRAAATSSSPLPKLSLSSTSSSSFEHGFFQVSDDMHSITTLLAESAESESRSLFELPLTDKLTSFPNDWPFGFHDDDDDHQTGSFCLDGSTLASTTTELRLASLAELTRKLEKLGLEVVERLACTLGFKNPFKEGVGPDLKHSSMMWISSSSSDGDKARKMYPYVVGMQYQIRPMKWELLSDSGSVNVEPEVGSVLVTLGDITQVWSNGKLKKVRGRPNPVLENGESSISMTLLLTLPLETTVSPLLIDHKNRNREKNHKEEGNEDIIQSIIEESSSNGNDNDNGDNSEGEHQRVFNSFSFEDYAWRVYHERLHMKDPLNRYRVY